MSFQKENLSVLAVYEIKKGDRLLIDAVTNNEKLDFDKIFSDILENLIELEKSNLYPGDLRSWNICLKNNDAFLIDFGNLQSSKEDSVANLFNKNLNFTVHDSFITLIYDCLTGNNYSTIKDFGLYSLTAFFDETKIEKKYANLFKSYFLLNKKDISFSEIKTLFESCVYKENEVSFSQDENIRILAELQNRLFKQKADYADLKIQELKIRNIENNQRNQDSFFNNKIAEHNTVIDSISQKLGSTKSRLNVLNEKIDSQFQNFSYALNTNCISKNAFGVTLENFHECEPGGIWTSDNKSKITINGSEIFYSEFSKKLMFRCHSINGGGTARILWNGNMLGEAEITQSTENFEFGLNNEICGRNQNVLEIEYGGSVTAPAELGLNDDTRKLGLWFEYVHIRTDISQRISTLDRRLLESEKILSQQFALNEQLQKRLDELNGLILNTRHRTLYGACAWLFRKIFKRK